MKRKGILAGRGGGSYGREWFKGYCRQAQAAAPLNLLKVLTGYTAR